LHALVGTNKGLVYLLYLLRA